MKCADEGFIQSYLDGECGHEESQTFAAHLEQCSQCRRLMEELSALEEWTRQTMEAEFRASAGVKVDTEAAWQTFSQKMGQHGVRMEPHASGKRETKRSWRTMNRNTKKWLTGGSVAAVLAVSLSFPQVQAAASDFLSIFRMDKVEFVKLTKNDLQDVEAWIARGQSGEMDLKGIGKVWIEGDDKKGEEHRFYTSREAAEKAGVKLPDLPKDIRLNDVSVSPAYTVQLEIDAEKANKLLAQLQVDARFDEKLSGKRFALDVPHMYSMTLESGGQFLNYGVVDAPKLKAPDGVDLAQLRNTLLALPFIPDNVKKQMVNIDDWQHTLPIPYVADKERSVKEVKVHGQDALLIAHESGSQLLWQENGRLHTLDGPEKSGEQLLALAKQLK